jgi:predicted Rossmann-fold nucleotide-binding protein
MPETRVVTTVADLARAWPDLTDVAVVQLDLTSWQFDWSEARFARTMFLGCTFPATVLAYVSECGGVLITAFPEVPFAPYRADLYSYEELASARSGAPRSGTLDEQIGAWFRPSSGALHDGAVRALHDATIDAALTRFVARRRIVGVMGGHAVARDAPLYRRVASLGRALTRAGFCVATGGGPGVMEAANLGAWFAPFDDAALDDALDVLASAPSYAAEPKVYVRCALDVRSRWPRGGESLGVPTWIYLHEPTTGFATHIAKYFTNSLREDGLLAIARSGVVYAPGGAGTEQEIFTDAAQNSLTLYEVRSPMVFLSRSFFEQDRPELVAGVRRQAKDFGWHDLVTVVDTAEEAVAFLGAHQPDDAAAGTVTRRRTHGAT